MVNVDIHNSDTYLNIHTSMFNWCVVRCASYNGHPQDMCFKETGRCAHNVLTFIGSIVSIFECV